MKGGAAWYGREICSEKSKHRYGNKKYHIEEFGEECALAEATNK